MAQQLSMPQSATQAQTIARRSEHTGAAGSPTAAETALVPGCSVVLEMDFQGLAGFVFLFFVFVFSGGTGSSISGVLCQRQEEASTADLKRAASLEQLCPH